MAKICYYFTLPPVSVFLIVENGPDMETQSNSLNDKIR